MTATSAIVIAAVLQIVLRTSFFIEQSKDLCSPAPSLSSWIFLIAFLDLISDLCLYPVRYMHLPYFCQVIVETIITILLTEFGAIVVWCTLEKLFCRLIKSILLVMGTPLQTYVQYEWIILGGVTTAISLLILAYVGQATDHFHMIRKKYNRIERKVALNLEMFWDYINCADTSSRKCRKCLYECCCRDIEEAIRCQKRRRRRRRC